MTKAEATYLPYLQEIQKKLTLVAITIFAAGALGFIYYQKILTVILSIFNLKGVTVVLTSPYQFLDLAVNTGLVTGFIAAFPLFVYFLVTFLKPALKPPEYKLLLRLVPVSLILFIVGFAFGGWIMQFVINIFSQTASTLNLENIWDVSHFLAQIVIMGLCLGLVFEMPVVLTLLIRFKAVKRETIARHRRYFYGAILVFAALLPPNDIISLSILTLVPLFLFEVSLLFNQ